MHQIGSYRSLALGQLIFKREQGTLRVEHVTEIDQTGLVALAGQFTCLARRYGCLGQRFSSQLLAGEGDQPVFDLFPGLQQGLLIIQQRLLLAFVLDLDRASDTAAIENRPGDTRAQTLGTAGRGEKVLGGQGFQAERTTQAKTWIEVRRGHADQRRLSRQLPFRPAHIGTLA